MKRKTESENIKYKRFDSERERYNCPKSPWRFLSEDLIVQTVNKEELSFVKQKDEDDVPKIENAAAQKESMNKVPDVK